MKALVKSYAKPGIWMEEVAIPEIGPNDVLVKISKTGICGTDAHIFHWDDWAQRNIQIPRVIGHEFSGEIADIGAAVKGYKIGERVTAEGHVTCGLCRNCRAGKRHLCEHSIGIGGGRDGAFAEYLSVPVSNLWWLHQEIDDEIGAVMDPLGNAVHSAFSFNLIGEDVLITGAGPIGILAASVCQFVGSRHVVIVDVNEYRLALARKMGIKNTLNPDVMKVQDMIQQLGMSNGFDVGLEMSGHPGIFNQMINNMYHGGYIGLLGFLPPATQVDWDQVLFKGLHMKGIYGREMYETWYKMTQLIRGGLDISNIITHRFKAKDYEQAFEVVLSGQCGKVVLDWNES